MLASTVIHELRGAGVEAPELTPVGSLRRFAPDVGNVAIFVSATPSERRRLLRTFTRLPSVRSVIAVADWGATVEVAHNPVTLHVATPEQTGAALLWLTGSVGHVHALSTAAAGRGLRFAAGALLDGGDRPVACPTEEDFYSLLDLPYIPPELRHGEDEIDAARQGRLPRLLSEIHIRGDLHMHSIWSDGRDTIEAMVRSSVKLGYEYIAITDHSQSAWSSRQLSLDDIGDQRSEIDLLRKQYPSIRILHGVEVDIMEDATLDFADEVLAGFDIVLASLHVHAGQSPEQLTARYLAAIENPFVNIITHPMNRAPGVTAGYDVDFDRIFAAAEATGTALEIDGAPGHLDMDGAVARRAVNAGVTVVVDSDCHRAEMLRRQMRFGVGTARRGWVEPRHVLNARGVNEVLAFVARKRAARA